MHGFWFSGWDVHAPLAEPDAFLGGGGRWLLQGGNLGEGMTWLLPGSYGDTVNERAVRILLECILV